VIYHKMQVTLPCLCKDRMEGGDRSRRTALEKREEMAEDYVDSDGEDKGEEEVVFVDDDCTSAKEEEGHCE
jgi:hypothetical protein